MNIIKWKCPLHGVAQIKVQCFSGGDVLLTYMCGCSHTVRSFTMDIFSIRVYDLVREDVVKGYELSLLGTLTNKAELIDNLKSVGFYMNDISYNLS